MAEETTKPSEQKEKKTVNLGASAQKILDEVKKLTVLEMADLVSAMEEEFGVSASAPVMAAAAGGAAAGGAPAQAAEKTSFNVELTSSGDKKIAVIKVVKEIIGLGLKEAKDLVDAAPKVIKENVAKKDAEAMKAKLEAEGATVNLK